MAVCSVPSGGGGWPGFRLARCCSHERYFCGHDARHGQQHDRSRRLPFHRPQWASNAVRARSRPGRLLDDMDVAVLALAGTATALATGLGAVPVFLLGERASQLRPFLWGTTVGLMG